jgi:hypothetical protein
MEGGTDDRKAGPAHLAGALTNGWLRPTCRFKVVDLGPGDTLSRQVVYRAECLEQAQEVYIGACETAGIVRGALRIFRCADWAAYA